MPWAGWGRLNVLGQHPGPLTRRERGSQGQLGRDKAAWEKPALLSASDALNKQLLVDT